MVEFSIPMDPPVAALVMSAPPAPSVELPLNVEPRMTALLLKNAIAPPPLVPDRLDEKVESVMVIMGEESQYITPAHAPGAWLPVKSEAVMERVAALPISKLPPRPARAVVWAILVCVLRKQRDP